MNILPSEVAEKYVGVFPVPIIKIANDLGIEVYQTDSFSDAQSGSLSKEEDGFVIYVNKSHAPTRKRFTIAHEIGHFLKHKDIFTDSQSEHVDTNKQVFSVNELYRAEDQELSEDERRREIEANKIAAELLMPEEPFKNIWRTKENIEEIAEYFFVSPSAATIRAKQLLGEFII